MKADRHLTSEELLSYYRHSLTGTKLNEIETHLAGCELCSEALKGLAEMKDAMNIYSITHGLKKKLSKKYTGRKNIFNRFDILNIILIFFVIGLILLLTFYFIFIRSH
jgi:hypothetical protein